METYRIYKIENTINSLLYVGYSRQVLECRLEQHIRASGSTDPVHLRNPLYIAMREYGTENFYIRLLEEGEYRGYEEFTLIFGRERYWMGKLNTIYPSGYNKHAHKLADTDAAIIRFNAYNLPGTQYAKLYAIHPSSVYNIQSGKVYRMYNHVTKEHLPVDIEAYAEEMMHMDFIEGRGDKLPHNKKKELG